MAARHEEDRPESAAERRETAPDAATAPTNRAETPADPATPPDGEEQDPPRTTAFGWLTVPKFGSAGSGGAELEPGPERG